MPNDEIDQLSTRDRILDAAEYLFSRNGFDDTSMRDITARAAVNLASVNYHFGSKDDLMSEIFLRCVDPVYIALNPKMDQLLRVTSDFHQALVDFFQTAIEAMLKYAREKEVGSALFIRLICRIYSESEKELRVAFAKRYSELLIKSIKFFRLTLPQVSRAEVFWRIHFVLGSLAFTMAGEKEICQIAAKVYEDKVSDEILQKRLVNFVVAGLEAEPI